LWCIDCNPAEIDYEWIKKDAFELKDSLDTSSIRRWAEAEVTNEEAQAKA
jgi:hypothetical protein